MSLVVLYREEIGLWMKLFCSPCDFRTFELLTVIRAHFTLILILGPFDRRRGTKITITHLLPDLFATWTARLGLRAVARRLGGATSLHALRRAVAQDSRHSARTQHSQRSNRVTFEDGEQQQDVGPASAGESMSGRTFHDHAPPRNFTFRFSS